MILQLEGEKEEIRLSALGTQPMLEDSTPVGPTTQPIPTVAKEEGEEIAVPVEKVDRYFLSPLAGSASLSVSKHLEVVHEHLRGTFPTDPAVSAQLQKSFLRVSKLADSLMAPEVEEVYQHLAVKLEMLAFNYKV